jgi:hypothetical protein
MQPTTATRRSIPIVLAIAIVATGCGSVESDETSFDRQLATAFEAGDAKDALSSTLVARQRRIFVILLGDDRRELPEYIAMSFRWNPPRGAEPMPFTTSGDAAYYAMLGDFRPSALTAVPAAYAVEALTPRIARVFAEMKGSSAGVVTFWQNGADGWKATEAFDVDYGLAEWQARLREADRLKRNR